MSNETGGNMKLNNLALSLEKQNIFSIIANTFTTLKESFLDIFRDDKSSYLKQKKRLLSEIETINSKRNKLTEEDVIISEFEVLKNEKLIALLKDDNLITTDIARTFISEIEKTKKELRNLAKLLELNYKEVAKYYSKNSFTLYDGDYDSIEGLHGEREISIEQELETILQALKKIRTPEEIIKRVQPISLFNNELLMFDEDNETIKIDYLQTSKSDKHILKSLTLEEIDEVINLIRTLLLDNTPDFSEIIYNSLKPLEALDISDLETLEDTPLSGLVEDILERIDYRECARNFTLPLNSSNQLYIVEGLIEWIRLSIKD